MKKIRVVRSIHLNRHAEIILYKLGFLNRDLKLVKTRNLSEFLSKLIVNRFDTPELAREIALFDLNSLQGEMTLLNNKIEKQALIVRSLKPVEVPQEIEGSF